MTSVSQRLRRLGSALGRGLYRLGAFPEGIAPASEFVTISADGWIESRSSTPPSLPPSSDERPALAEKNPVLLAGIEVMKST
jgi:hypothetical protein